MSLAEKKQALRFMIEDADEKLTGLLIALANEYNDPGDEYSNDEIKSFYKTRDEYLQNPKKVFAVEEAHQKIINKDRDEI